MEQDGGSGCGMKWWNSGYIFKVEPLDLVRDKIWGVSQNVEPRMISRLLC